ncbi:uncharacterized protein LOC143850820 [Tasmannia lanceolata]|uniref:uncharacterized protein LOC143850820 n=1 Tax=Tasmannia lanceolata TaxID=3420 RepID=UPI0040633B79
MTVEKSDCNGVPECSKVEFEGNSGSNLSPCEDLENAGDCNVVECENVEEIEGEAKDDTDGSYEFVNGESDDAGERDLDAVCVIDPVEAVKTECDVEGNVVFDPNVISQSEEKEVESDELSEKKGDDGEICVGNSCSVNESDLLCSNPEIHEQENPNIDGMKVNDVVGDQKELDLAVQPEENQECETVALEGVKSDLNLIENGKEDVGSELDQLENGKETETSNVFDEITVEGSASPDLELEPANSAMEDTELEVEVRHEPIESRELESEEINCSLESKKLETEVKTTSVEIGELEDEARNDSVNGGETESKLVENCESEIEGRNDPVGSKQIMPSCPVEDIKPEIEVINDSVDTGESMPTCPVEDMQPETEVANGSAENGDAAPICSDVLMELEPTDINGSDETGQRLPICPDTNMIFKDEVRSDYIESGESLTTGVNDGPAEGGESMSTCNVEDLKSETKVSNGSIKISADPVSDTESKSEVGTDTVEVVESMPTCPIVDAELEAGAIINDLVEIAKVTGTGHVDVAELDPVVENCCVGSESTPDSVANVVDLECEDQPTYMDDVNKNLHEDVASVKGVSSDGILPSSEKDSSAAAAVDAQNADAEMGKRLPNFLIRIPRYSDDKIREQIKLAQLQVDEKTQSRDSIRVAVQLKKATCNEYREKLEAAKLEERAARDAFNVKRQEIDSVQALINKMKNATSIEEIDERIQNMEHKIGHETMPLKEEKQLIREIKQLKHAREQLCANMGTQTEIQEAFDQRDSIEERFKLLKKEMDSLRNEVLRTESITKAAKKKYYEELDIVRELQAQYNSADDCRQEAYAQLQSLKKQLYEKNKYFRMYKEDEKAAASYASAGDKDSLQSLCSNQVEKIMELWNKNDEFRNEYIKHNVFSTVRRLKTLDGRSLGPDEEPPMLRNPAMEKIDSARLTSAKINAALSSSSDTMKEKSIAEPPQKVDLKPTVDTAQKNPSAKSKKTPKPSGETGSATVSSRVETEEEIEKETKRREEEEELVRKEKELARKEEELRKQEAEIKLKEQRRLEEKSKAKEAEERKRRNAEKAKTRAELRAQREAELKEKEREKRARKKEKKTMATDITNGENDTESAPVSDNKTSETVRETEVKERPSIKMGKTVKSVAVAKQTKTKTLPLSLRNRGKRKMQPWMWALLITVLVLALFLVSNGAFSLTPVLPKFGF